MSGEYLSDREQEEALRNWWRENWRWVVVGIVIGFTLLGSWNAWQRYRQQRAEAAAQLYHELTTALQANDKDKVDATLKRLVADHAGSPYTDQAHLQLARMHVNAGNFDLAAGELKAVIDDSSDAALVQVAKLRLARVRLQLGQHDEALALLDVRKAGRFAAQVHELRGDVLLAQGDSAGARVAYEAAVAAARATDLRAAPDGDDFLSLKLQELTSLPTSAAAPAIPNVPK